MPNDAIHDYIMQHAVLGNGNRPYIDVAIADNGPSIQFYGVSRATLINRRVRHDGVEFIITADEEVAPGQVFLWDNSRGLAAYAVTETDGGTMIKVPRLQFTTPPIPQHTCMTHEEHMASLFAKRLKVLQ